MVAETGVLTKARGRVAITIPGRLTPAASASPARRKICPCTGSGNVPLRWLMSGSGAPLCALVLAACAPAPAREAAPAQPSIVSLNPCTDAVLVEVADPVQILALSSYSSDPNASSMDLAVARRFPAVKQSRFAL